MSKKIKKWDVLEVSRVSSKFIECFRMFSQVLSVLWACAQDCGCAAGTWATVRSGHSRRSRLSGSIGRPATAELRLADR